MRTDMLWDGFSDRTKGMIDSLAFILFFLPTMAVLFYISIDDFFYSISIDERSSSGAWTPILWPLRGVIPLTAFMLSLQADIENAGGMVALRSPVESMRVLQEGGMALRMEDGTELWAGTVVNAAGLSAPALARRCHGLAQATVPQAHYAKGSYFALAGAAPFSRLIYPVPEAAGLGVHLTLDLGGQAKFGPDVEWVESPDDLLVDPRRAQGFYAEVRRYWPQLPDGALLRGYAGIRPKIHGPGEPAADFMIQGPADHGVPGLVNLFGIESPGLTSALAIGEWAASKAGLATC